MLRLRPSGHRARSGTGGCCCFQQAARTQINARARHKPGAANLLRGEGRAAELRHGRNPFSPSRAGRAYAPAMVNLARMYSLGQRRRAQRVGSGVVVVPGRRRKPAMPRAQFTTGALHARGEGVAAAPWPRRRAGSRRRPGRGHAAAQFNIAIFYLDGAGVARDPAKAAEWFRTGPPSRGWRRRRTKLGKLYLSGDGGWAAATTRRRRKWLGRGGRGRPTRKARTALGLLFLHGHGVERDLLAAEGAVPGRRADRGHAPALFQLGHFYAEDRGGGRTPCRGGALLYPPRRPRKDMSRRS